MTVREFLESQGETLTSLKVRFSRGTFKLSTREGAGVTTAEEAETGL
jgi:hypothetical protein